MLKNQFKKIVTGAALALAITLSATLAFANSEQGSCSTCIKNKYLAKDTCTVYTTTWPWMRAGEEALCEDFQGGTCDTDKTFTCKIKN